MNLTDRINAWIVSKHDLAEDSLLLRELEESTRVRGEPDAVAGYFSSVSGGACYLARPMDSCIRIFDIALSLSRVARWGGRTSPDKTFYSVAEHSVRVSQLCRPEHALLGLLHDAPEAYLGDVISPLKRKLKDVYGPLEASWAKAIGHHLELPRFGFHSEALAYLPPDVKVADLIALEVERHDLLTRGEMWKHWGSLERPTLLPTIDPMNEFEAFWLFMARYRELTAPFDTNPAHQGAYH